MRIKQISVLIENSKGALADVCTTLADKGVNMRALSLADTQDFGILRIIVEDTDAALEILREAGYTCKTTYVIAVAISDTPGGMAKAIKKITDEGIDVEYAYAFLSHKAGKAYMVFRMSHSKEADAKLAKMGMALADTSELFG